MFRMAVGHSDDVDLEGALETVFAECDAALAGATPTAGLLMSAWEVEHQPLVDAVLARYPGIELAGASAAGEMSSVLGFREDSVALALFASEEIDVVAGLGQSLAADPIAAARQAVAEAMGKTQQRAKLCIVLPTIGTSDLDAALATLREELGPGVPLVGGGASPEDPARDTRADDSRQFVGDVITHGAMAILVFAGPLACSVGVETGWRGVGPRATITASSGPTVFEIDGRPALELYERYIGEGQPPIANPLAVFEDAPADRFYLRTPVSYDRETGAIVFFGDVPTGATVQITMAAIDEVFEGAQASIASALAGFPAGANPAAALLFSCATRKFLLGTRASRELELVRDELGPSVPVGGFYCLGEIAPSAPADLTRFHNATMVSVLLGAMASETDAAA